MTPSEIGSSPAKGSSYMISIGSSATARASATRRAMPPDKLTRHQRVRTAQTNALSFISTRSRIISSDRSVCSRIRKGDVVENLMSVNSAPNWNSMPILRRNRKALRASCRKPGVFRAHHAAGRPQLAADAAQQRRLAAAGPAHDGDHLAARDLHVDSLQHRPSVIVESADPGYRPECRPTKCIPQKDRRFYQKARAFAGIAAIIVNNFTKSFMHSALSEQAPAAHCRRRPADQRRAELCLRGGFRCRHQPLPPALPTPAPAVAPAPQAALVDLGLPPTAASSR
jgi:hypothetical protein